MLGIQTALEETRSYKELTGIGRVEGREKGREEGLKIGELKGKIITMKELYQEGVLTRKIYQKRVQPLEKELAALEKMETDFGDN